MSAAPVRTVPTATAEGRVSYSFLLRSVLVGQVAGAVCLWVIALVISPVAHFRTGSNTIYGPWQLDGWWSVEASLGWGVLLSALIGGAVRHRLRMRTGETPSRTLTLAAVAAGGYTPCLLATNPTTRLVIAVIATPLIVRCLVVRESGYLRVPPPPLEFTPRGFSALLLVSSGLLIAPFALAFQRQPTQGSLGVAVRTADLAHLTAQPSLTVRAGLDAGYLNRTYGGGPVQGEAGLTAGRSAITVTRVRLIEPAGAQQDATTTLRIGAPPFGHGRPLVLPTRVLPRHTLWLGYSVALARCPGPTTSITRVQVSYRLHGSSRTQTSPPFGGHISLSCP